jgi:RNAse (barnase) inhibitor barstar
MENDIISKMKTIIINGKNFSFLDGFYNEIEKYLLDGECPWGRNLDSLDEIVSTSFNYTGNPDNNVSKIIWTEFSKSKLEIQDKRGDRFVVDILEEIFTSNEEITFEKK